jgi:hypothetical protein
MFLVVNVIAFSAIWIIKSKKFQSENFEISSSFLFSIVSLYLSYYNLVIILFLSILFSPVNQSEKSIDALLTQISKAKADQNIPLLRDLLKQKAEFDKTATNRKESNFIKGYHRMYMTSLYLLYVPVLLYTASSFIFVNSILNDGMR